MPEQWRYRGQNIDSEQVAQLREFIAAHPESSRWKLSRQLCEALGWKQPNGALRDVVCRGLLLMLERAGQIELPPVRRIIRGQRRNARPRPEAVWIDTTPIQVRFVELGPVELEQVRRTADEELFNRLMEHHHYLGYVDRWRLDSLARQGRSNAPPQPAGQTGAGIAIGPPVPPPAPRAFHS